MAETESRIRREKLVYARLFAEHESFLQTAEADLRAAGAHWEQIVELNDRLERMLAVQRKKIYRAGGHVIDVSLKTIVCLPPGKDIETQLSEIRQDIESSHPGTTEFDIAPFEDEDGLQRHELYIFTDRRLIVPVLRIINAATDNEYELSPFSFTRIPEESQRIAEISSPSGARRYLDEQIKGVGLDTDPTLDYR